MDRIDQIKCLDNLGRAFVVEPSFSGAAYRIFKDCQVNSIGLFPKDGGIFCGLIDKTTITVAVEAFNEAVRDGTLGDEYIWSRLSHYAKFLNEVAYFYNQGLYNYFLGSKYPTMIVAHVWGTGVVDGGFMAENVPLYRCDFAKIDASPQSKLAWVLFSELFFWCDFLNHIPLYNGDGLHKYLKRLYAYKILEACGYDLTSFIHNESEMQMIDF